MNNERGERHCFNCNVRIINNHKYQMCPIQFIHYNANVNCNHWKEENKNERLKK